MNDFVAGAIVALCGVAALHFWNFHRHTRDLLFAFFALAFATLGVSFLFLAAGDGESEFRPHVFLMRLAAFVLIIAGIFEKNRRVRDRR
jgi:hypothetical protein